MKGRRTRNIINLAKKKKAEEYKNVFGKIKKILIKNALLKKYKNKKTQQSYRVNEECHRTKQTFVVTVSTF